MEKHNFKLWMCTCAMCMVLSNWNPPKPCSKPLSLYEESWVEKQTMDIHICVCVYVKRRAFKLWETNIYNNFWWENNSVSANRFTNANFYRWSAVRCYKSNTQNSILQTVNCYLMSQHHKMQNTIQWCVRLCAIVHFVRCVFAIEHRTTHTLAHTPRHSFIADAYS